MDTSKEYIKMCEKAEEIQDEVFKNRIIFALSWFHLDVKDKICQFQTDLDIYYEKEDKLWLVRCDFKQKPIPFIEIPSYNFYKYADGHLNYIWLPRQDQLQDMLDESIPMLLNSFTDWCNGTPRLTFYTWEQLWLAFVMREKYNKTWSGKEWEGEKIK